MDWWVQVYAVALVASIAIAAGLAVYTWRHRDRRGAIPLLATFLGPLLWQGSALLAVLGRGTQAALFWQRTTLVGSGLVVVGFFMFALVYTGRDELATLRTAGLLSAIPLSTVVLALTNPVHGLYWTVTGRAESALLGFAIEYGPLFYWDTIYGYAMLVVGTALILEYAFDAAAIYRYQTTALLTAVCVPWLTHVLVTTGVVGIDPTPVAFAISGVALWWGIFRAEFIDLAPIGRETVVDDLYDGVFTINRDHRLVDVNPAGRELFDYDEDDDIVGQHIDDILAAFPETRETYWSVVGSDGDTEFETQVGDRHYHLQVLSLGDEDSDLGRTIHVQDVTARKRREAELEQQNRRLERFTNVVSHDLRNPLNVIQSRAELAQRDHPEDPNLDAIATNADRIEHIVEDVLTMTREGDVQRRENVDVATVARRAWDHVETGTATLATPVEETVSADPNRLVQVFENLFRNAVEHGSADQSDDAGDAKSDGSASNTTAADVAAADGEEGVTVRVGGLDDRSGFFVADDGVGIPEADRETILEDGYTTSESGTGLGLSIVSEIVDAHGWTLAVEASSTGGARFEVAVTPADTGSRADHRDRSDAGQPTSPD